MSRWKVPVWTDTGFRVVPVKRSPNRPSMPNRPFMTAVAAVVILFVIVALWLYVADAPL